jgi:ribosomal protein L37E
MNDTARVYLEAEVKCYLCGHSSGRVRKDRGENGTRLSFVRSGADVEQPIGGKTQIHCARCGGPTYFDEFELKTLWKKVDFLEDRPRRGRPPKILAQRRGAA